MAITETGLEIRRFPEVEKDIQDELTDNLSTALVFDTDTLLGQLVSVIGAEIADEEALIQAVYDSFDIDKAEGVSLDRLVALIGVTRLSAAFTTGIQQFNGSDGTTVQAGSILSNPSSNAEFETLLELSLTPSSCEDVTYSVSTVLDNETYQITVNGTVFSYLSDANATVDEIVDGLVQQVNLPASKSWTASNVLSKLFIKTNSQSNIEVSAITFLLVDSVTASTLAKATVTGEIRGPANSITNSVTSISGLISTTNPLSYSTGRDIESDEELRQRAQESTQLAGSSTVPANLAAVSNVEGVNAVSLVENLTSSIDGEGRAPHSYEMIVDGGVDGDIGQAIFNEKPAGIETSGDISVPVIDASGATRIIWFSRPEDIHIAVRVTYDLYDEESFPINGAEEIVNAVLATGEDLNVGDDVIPKRFYGPIYDSVEGINDLTVEMQVLASSGDAPLGGSWSGDKISISGSQVASFNLIDITTVQE